MNSFPTNENPGNFYQNKQIFNLNIEKTQNFNERNDKKVEIDKKPNYARNIRGRLGFFNETPEEILQKEQKKNEYKDYIESQIEEKKKLKDLEKKFKIQMELKEESKIRKQIDDINHFSNDSKNFDKSSFFSFFFLVFFNLMMNFIRFEEHY